MSILATPPPHQRIWTYSEILRRLLLLKKLGSFKFFSYGKSGEGHKLWATRFGTGDKRVMLCCRQHGTEYTSTHAMVYLMNAMANHPEQYADIFQALDIIIIPVYNPDGALYYDWVRQHGVRWHYKIMGMFNLTTGRTLSKMARDPNRDHRKQRWPETRAFAKLMEDFQPHLFLDLHNFGFSSNLYTTRPSHFKRDCMCPLVVDSPTVSKDLCKQCIRIANVMRDAITQVGLYPAKINQLYPWPFDSTLRNINCAQNYYLEKKGIPSITVEVLGDFGMGDIFYDQSVPANLLAVLSVLRAMAAGKI
ncbi:MAG TPA: M14 family zinc carboxypeptidase [Candidatus Lokiarchaeia archaeon]|nr:M14 family zinc carboxypeptidase [Candidatus Lokiarchaeia archaeon]